ncbi:MAG TPA: ATP-binding protein [Gallionellaceae bacterium]|nr:ATP-binding protein [Gallionellaceae bacterium]
MEFESRWTKWREPAIAAGLLVVVVLLSQQIIVGYFKSQIEKDLKRRASEVADGLINGMNMLMVTGQISKPENRELMVRKMKDSEGVIGLRIIRAKQVQDQFGPGLPSEQPKDAWDLKAMDTKSPVYSKIDWGNPDHGFRAVIPFVVSKDFRGTDCLSCHHVKDGSVNGAASVILDTRDDDAKVAMFQRWVWAGDAGFAMILSLVVVWRAGQRKREELMREVESANEELRNFAYVVSHDLKAPLRAIGSLADWISTDYADKFDEEGKEHLRLLMSRVRRMDGLIEGILLYSRVGRVKEAVVPVDLNQLVDKVVAMLAPPANIAITVAHPLPTVMIEPTRIQQVFQNLISNAIKYMDKAEGRIHIACGPEGHHHWKFSVADNGPGIRQQHFDKIFQLFQTLAPRDRVESSGVGLALVKKIVEMYGGRVWLESAVGEGSTFYFTLPRTPIVPAAGKGGKHENHE